MSGYSGIGKSSVVNELHKVLLPSRGLFATGKFDQYKRDIPYATLAQSFQGLVRQLLGGERCGTGRAGATRAAGAIGKNGQLMVGLIPELALIIGEQPPVPDLPLQEAQSALPIGVPAIPRGVRGPEHPLVAVPRRFAVAGHRDARLLERLITDSDMRHLLLIGAYRDDEVETRAPALRALEAVRSAGGARAGDRACPRWRRMTGLG